jgi:hypothetical protein
MIISNNRLSPRNQLISKDLITKYLFEEENNEIRIALSESIEKDVKEYVETLYDLKHEE